MALLICTECGGKVADRAEKCPHCGLPMAELLKDLEKKNTVETPAASISVGDKSCDCTQFPTLTKMLPAEALKSSSAESKSASAGNGDFEIKDGVLVKYKGKGGDVVIPYGVTAIGNRAFYECKSLVSVTIPEGVTKIGAYAFYQCPSLRSVTFPRSLKSIKEYAFYDCRSLRSVTVPEGVTKIGDYAFSFCIYLTEITVPHSVKTIGDHAFRWCNALDSVTIQGKNTDIGIGAFAGTPYWERQKCRYY